MAGVCAASRLCGADRDRTGDLWLAKPPLSQLSYSPSSVTLGLSGIEPLTSRLSGARSNHLSYRPNRYLRRLQTGLRLLAAIFLHSQLKKVCPTRYLSLDHRCDLSLVEGSFTPMLLRKEVIQPQLPLRLPCYDLAPVISITFGAALLAVRQATSGAPNFRGLTGGVYKARERIHRYLLISDY